MRKFGKVEANLLFRVAVLPAVAILFAATASAQQSMQNSATNQRDFPFNIPAASEPGGSFVSMAFHAPPGRMIRNAQLICKSGCLFNILRPKRVSVSKVVVEGLSAGSAASYVLRMDLAIPGQPHDLPPADAVPPPPALADTARDQQVSTINLIRDTALQMCGTVPIDGTGANVSLSAEASAKVSGLLSKLFSADAGAKAEDDKQRYYNVLQADLPIIIRDNTNCRLVVFKGLLDKLFPTK